MSGQYPPPSDRDSRYRPQQPQQTPQPRRRDYSPIPPPPIGANYRPPQQAPQPGQSAGVGSGYGNYPPAPRSTSALSNSSNRNRSAPNPERQLVRRNMTTDLIPSPAVPRSENGRRSSFDFTPLGPRAPTPPSGTSHPPARRPVERQPLSALAGVAFDRTLDLRHTQRGNRAPGYEGLSDSQATRQAVRDLPNYLVGKVERGLGSIFGGGSSSSQHRRQRRGDRERRDGRRDHSQDSTTSSTERRRR